MSQAVHGTSVRQSVNSAAIVARKFIALDKEDQSNLEIKAEITIAFDRVSRALTSKNVKTDDLNVSAWQALMRGYDERDPQAIYLPVIKACLLRLLDMQDTLDLRAVSDPGKSSQERASRKWEARNRDRARYIRDRSAARNFLKKKATDSDIDEMLEIINQRNAQEA